MNNNTSLSGPRFWLFTVLGVSIILLVAWISGQPAGLKESVQKAFESDSVAQAIARVPETTDLRSLDIKHWVSSLGTPVYFIRTEQPEMLDIRLDFNSGSTRDGDLHGLSALTSRMLGSATKDKSQDDIYQQFELLGSQFGSNSSFEQLSIELRTLSEKSHREPSIRLMTEVVSQPVFLQKNLNRIRNQLQEEIRSQSKQPELQSLLKASELAYQQSPYSHWPSGSEPSLASIDLKDIEQFHRNHFSARNLSIAIVGDITREQAEQISEQISLAFPIGKKSAPVPSPPAHSNVTAHIDSDSSQSAITMAALGVPRSSSDHAALILANEIFGGGSFAAILMKEIRDRQGLTYGIYSHFDFHLYTGLFLIETQTRSEQTEQTLSEIKRLLTDFVKEGPTEQQMTEAKKIIRGGLSVYLSTNKGLLSLLSRTGFCHLPLNHMDQFLDALDHLTPEQVRSAFAKVIDPDRMITVVAGKTAKID